MNIIYYFLILLFILKLSDSNNLKLKLCLFSLKLFKKLFSGL